jgi:glycosyltransferase involved in cell wall biosynthesis
LTESPQISFVVPSYNYGRYLPDCLNSIFGQEGSYDFEVIAIDDASTDDTSQVLASFGDSRLRVVRHAENLGHVSTVNEGMSLARGAFIARIDPDDRYRPHFLATLMPRFSEYPEIGLAYADAALMDETGRVNCERSDQVHRSRDFKGNEFLLLLENNCICAPTAIARREAWMQALPIPAGLAFNDWYFNLMIARRWDFHYADTVVADYRVHSQNHHTKIVLDRSEERSIFALLDRVFCEAEASEALETSKRRARSHIYATNYTRLADKYFGAHMNSDARRCYLAAIRHNPGHLVNFGVQRRLAATVLGRERYEFSKALIKGALARGKS